MSLVEESALVCSPESSHGLVMGMTVLFAVYVGLDTCIALVALVNTLRKHNDAA